MDIRSTVVARFLTLCSTAGLDDEQKAQVLKTLAMISDEYIHLCHEDYVQGNQAMASWVRYVWYSTTIHVIKLL